MNCCSKNRCRSPACDTCRWRYSRQVARRILPNGRHFFAADIAFEDVSFRRWCTQARNVVEYRRTLSPRWRDVSVRVWLCRSQRVSGVVALAGVSEADFRDAFSRWPTTLRAIDQGEVRAEIYHAVHPDRIAIVPDGRRYQSISFRVGPRRSRSTIPLPWWDVSAPVIEPLPLLVCIGFQ